MDDNASNDEAFVDELRAALRAGTAELTTPPDLLDGVRRSYNRRITAMWLTGVALVIVALGGASLITGPLRFGSAAPVPASVCPGTSNPPAGAPASTGIPEPNPAVLTARISKAIDDAQHDVVYLHTNDVLGTGEAAESYIWERAAGAAFREDDYVDGVHAMDQSVDYLTGKSISVDYPTRSYESITMNPGDILSPVDVTDSADIKQAITAGCLRIVGAERIDEQLTIHLVSDNGTNIWPPGTQVWVNAANYLPVRYSYSINTQVASGATKKRTADLDYLPATTTNLALLTTPIPPGFTRRQ